MGITADISGVSAAPSEIDPDLMVIYKGGDNFIARMAALTKAKSDAEDALAALQLGQDTKAAYSEANSKSADAHQALADAQAQAAQIVAEAQAQAKSIADEATRSRDDLMAKAQSTSDTADAKVKQANDTLVQAQNDAARIVGEAQSRQDAANQLMDQAAAKGHDADQRKADSEAEIAKAKALQDQLSAKLAALRSAIAQVTNEQ